MFRVNIGPGMTRHLNATMGRLMEGGFSINGALDAWHTLDSHLFGFTVQELSLPFAVEESSPVSADVLSQLPADEFLHVVEVITEIMRTGRARRTSRSGSSSSSTVSSALSTENDGDTLRTAHRPARPGPNGRSPYFRDGSPRPTA